MMIIFLTVDQAGDAKLKNCENIGIERDWFR